uniref:VWFA domain-containing protein n=1 Tax=Periophthalmus magnuspinnatus TaxID=409849 RepID=A0A3B4AFK9_9GOBI
MRDPEVYNGSADDFFGFKVLQVGSKSNKDPNVVVRCNENSYMNSVCYNLTEQLEEQSVFKPAFQGGNTVDLAFLFDGSLSMTEKEFEENKYFIEDIMSNLKNTSIKFAAVQFSTEVRTVFTFNDYTEVLMLFYLQAYLYATKVLVLITDGDPSDSDRAYGSIMKYDSMVDVTKLKLIASEPKDNNTFHIENYNGLTGVLENFQKKIFQTEGLKKKKIHSAHKKTNKLVTLWLTFHYIQAPKKVILVLQMNLCLLYWSAITVGYSVSVGEKNTTALYFTGAPRYQHMGQVVLFTSTAGKWTPTQRINGEQHGSYFGAEVCSVDVDSDGNTDFLFVGAPLFYQTHHVFLSFVPQMKLIKLHNITAHVMGRFGTTIASVADVNGDGLRDAVVGAPLENQNRGAVYLYLGDRTRVSPYTTL